MTTRGLTQLLAYIITVGGLVLFLAIHWVPLGSILASPASKLPAALNASTYSNTATSLAGLVGGVIASGFGLPRPEPPQPLPKTRLHRGARGMRRVMGLDLFTRNQNDRRVELIVALYVGGYLLTGVTALIVTLVGMSPPHYIESLGFLALGVIIAVANSIMND